MKKLLTIALAISSLWATSQSTDGMEVVFKDDFKNNKNGWETSLKYVNKSKVDNDKEFLAISIADAKSLKEASVYTQIDFNKDFVLTARMKSLPKDKQPEKDGQFGILVGYTSYKYSKDQAWYGYRLGTSDENKVFLRARNSNGTILFTRDISNASYNSDDDTRIGLEKKNDEIIFYLNGKEIYRNDATETPGGAISFYAYDKQLATLKDLKVYQMAEPTPEEVAEEEAIAEVITEEEEEVILEAVSNLEFDTGKSTIKAASTGPLNTMAEMMVRNTKFKVLLKGHTDSQGSDAVNLKLSQSRVDKVKEYLTSKGIDGSRIVALGYGDKQPIATNETGEGRQKNRRVEFEIIQ